MDWQGVAVASVFVVGATGVAADAQDKPGRAPRALYDTRLSTPASARTTNQPDPALQLKLTSRYSFAPAMVRSLVRVAPHKDNRALRVEIDSPSFYRSSEIELEGDRAAQNHFFSWKSLPPGVYSVAVTVLGPDGPRASRSLPFEVLGPNSVAPY
jgi:hypothetical protein